MMRLEKYQSHNRMPSRNELRHGRNCRINNWNRLLKVDGVRIQEIRECEPFYCGFSIQRDAIAKLGLALKHEGDLRRSDQILGCAYHGGEDYEGDASPAKYYVVIA